MNGRRFLLASALVLASCGAPLREIPVFLDPSNPAAPESAAPSLPGTAGDHASTSPAAEEQSEPGAPRQPRGHAHVSHGRPGQPPGASEPPSPENPSPAAGGNASASWTCPMHPQVVQPAPGQCPSCGMKLVPQPAPPKDAQPVHDHVPAPPGSGHHLQPQPSGPQGGTP